MLAKLEKFLASPNRRNWIFLFLAIFLTLETIFIWLALWVMMNPENGFDLFLARAIHSWQSPFWDQLLTFVSWIGDSFLPLALIIFLGLGLKKYFGKRVYLLLGLLVVCYLVPQLVKVLIDRPRPDFYLLVGYSLPVGSSFPSVHVTFYTFFFGFLILLFSTLPQIQKGLRFLVIALSVILVSLIGLSRIYLGVHWPTDVIGGYLLGLVLLKIIWVVYLLLVLKSKKF
jgi:undecaprenyl-diphosphatase